MMKCQDELGFTPFHYACRHNPKKDELELVRLLIDLSPDSVFILAHAYIAWAGSNTSNLLACVQRKGRNGRKIVFLEPNELQHGVSGSILSMALC